ncbi:MAG: hypothetical protein ACR2PZ_17155 [Pseudomonadales bacterium]
MLIRQQTTSTNCGRARRVWLRALMALTVLLSSLAASADPISVTPRFYFAGNVNYTVTGATLRTQPNSGNSCAVGNTASAALAGVPLGANILNAYLYWAGSGPTADNTVTFNGTTVTADRQFSESYSLPGLNLDFFSGFADVTALVSGNGTYTLADLSVTTTDIGGDGDYCSRSAVLSGWGLIVVYEDSAEPLRVINLYDGFQQFRGSQIQVSPSNFRIPSAPIDGKIAILSWEGDVENSAALGGISENLTFDGENTPAINLTDATNPVNNQFNSTINVSATTTSYGVDFDVYDISSRLTAGDTGATTTYASGGDLVLLSLQAVSTTNTAVVDLALSKSLETANFSNAAPATYRLTVSNVGPSAENAPITLVDTLPAGLTLASTSSTDSNWNCSGSTVVTCTHPGPIAPAASLADVMITAAVDPSISAPVTNSATVSSTSFDGNTTNNTASHTANSIVAPDLTTSSKTVQDLNGGSIQPGDTLRYRINIVESAGADIADLALLDPIDALLTNLQIVSSGGGVDASTPTQLSISGINVAASSTVTVTFDVDVVASAVSNDLISNAATLSHTGTGINQLVSAPDVIVGGSVIPTSGIKPLYFGDIQGTSNAPALPLELTRAPLTTTSSPERVRIRRQDNDRTWRLSPNLSSDLGLDTDPIPVRLFLRRNNNTSTRNIRVSLTHGVANTLIGCVDASISTAGAAGLSNSQTRAFDFAIVQTDASCAPIAAAPLSIPSGSYVALTVDNEPNAGSGQAVFVYPYDTASGESSRAELPATTIINVDSVGWFDAAGGGSVLSSLVAGQTAYLRALVSDPFGSADITAASFELFDATGTSVSTGALAEIAATAGTKTYEVGYTVPLDAVNGTWTAAVSAAEGTEGNITHTAYGNVEVTGGAGLRVEKTLAVTFDGSSPSAPKAIPGAEVEYAITVTNDGGDPIEADSIEIRDQLPGELTYLLGNPLDPITFIDGTPSSNLSFTFSGLASTTDDVEFSNDGGASFITPVVDADGADATIPPINFILVTPQGTMPANGGSAPSFEIRLRMRIP